MIRRQSMGGGMYVQSPKFGSCDSDTSRKNIKVNSNDEQTLKQKVIEFI